MRSQFSAFLWAILAVPTAARHLSKLPGAVDVKIGSSTPHELVRKDVDHTETFSWSEEGSPIIDLDVDPNNFEVNCTSCQLSGSIRALFDERIDVWESDLNISFTETSAYVDLSILGASGTEQIVPLWSIGGISVAGVQATFGLGFFIELVISVDGELEATGGFEFTIPDGSWVAASLTGEIVGANFDGANGDLLTWDVTHGSTTLKISLRLRTELGVRTQILGLGTDAAVGVYLNLIEFVVTFDDDDSDETCALEATESWNVNAGAYAELDVDLDNINLDAAPTKSTTFYTGPTYTQCLEDITKTESGTIVDGTPAPATPTQPTITSSSGATETSDCDEVEDIPYVIETAYITETAYATVTADCDGPNTTPASSTLKAVVNYD
ncbi:hypothetical protein B0J13DRAFT_661054 [Dactylonectria estremocensis]|uniref:DUF7223 domain-containing protein n=1 Tax=Dactylonectria estremocensis TaxID=1079267 RepID=A0A9P9F1M5_9HYPO|nr:hypothetical protein B0J13DRAFT_661054 [Dactylonectria estremocensis]